MTTRSRSSGAVPGATLLGARVCELLHGIEFDAALRGIASDRALILAAFRRGFLAAALLAAASAIGAARLPRRRP